MTVMDSNAIGRPGRRRIERVRGGGRGKPAWFHLLTVAALGWVAWGNGGFVPSARAGLVQANADDSPAGPPMIHFKSRAFRIPFHVDPADRDRLKLVRLCASGDQGRTWKVAGQTEPDRPFFAHEAPSDGEYWFAVQTMDANGEVYPDRDAAIEPTLKVVVDTVPPTATLQPVGRKGGRVALDWECRDDHLDPATLKLLYRTEDRDWTAVPLERRAASGRAQWETGSSGRIEVALSVADRAGNLGRFEAAIPAVSSASQVGAAAVESMEPRRGDRLEAASTAAGLDRVAPGTVLAPVPDEGGFSLGAIAAAALSGDSIPAPPTLDDSPPRPAPPSEAPANFDRSAATPSGANPLGNRPTELDELARALDSLPQASRSSTTSPAPVPEPIRMADADTLPRRGFEAVETPPTTSPLANPPLPNAKAMTPPARLEPGMSSGRPIDPFAGSPEPASAGMTGSANSSRSEDGNATALPTLLLGTPRFPLDYSVEDAGPEGPAVVELWMTRDRGRTWSRHSEDPDRAPPYLVDLGGEGMYGLRIVARSATGQGDAPPVAGDAPHIWVEVDTSPPLIQLDRPEVGTGPHLGKVAITWRAEDAHLGSPCVLLSWRAEDRPDGPWTRITDPMDNVGQYVWVVPSHVPPRIHVRIDVIDTLKNRSYADTTASGPIVIDRSNPKGKILGLAPGFQQGTARR
mgnify:CR=1 FL=1